MRVAVDRPLRRAMLNTSRLRRHYFNIEQGTARSTIRGRPGRLYTKNGRGRRPRLQRNITAATNCGSVSIFMTTPSTMAKGSRSPPPSGVEVLGEITPAFSEILTPEALAFVAKLPRQ